MTGYVEHNLKWDSKRYSTNMLKRIPDDVKSRPMDEITREDVRNLAFGIVGDNLSRSTVKTLRAEKSAETLSRRREAAGKIAALRYEESAVLPKLQADLEEKEAVHAAAKAVLEGAAVKVQAATLAFRQARLTFGTTIGNCEAALLQNYDPAIDEAITFFRGKLDGINDGL